MRWFKLLIPLSSAWLFCGTRDSNRRDSRCSRVRIPTSSSAIQDTVPKIMGCRVPAECFLRVIMYAPLHITRHSAIAIGRTAFHLFQQGLGGEFVQNSPLSVSTRVNRSVQFIHSPAATVSSSSFG